MITFTIEGQRGVTALFESLDGVCNFVATHYRPRHFTIVSGIHEGRYTWFDGKYRKLDN